MAWDGASEGRVNGKIFTNWGGPNLLCSQPGKGHTFQQGRFLFKSTLLSVNKHTKSLEK